MSEVNLPELQPKPQNVVEVEYVGAFDTPETPFSIKVDQIGLTDFLTQILGLQQIDVDQLHLQIAAADVPLREGVKHPINKIKTIFHPNPRMIKTLIDDRRVDGTRTITLFAGRIFRQYEESCRYSCQKHFSIQNIKEENTCCW